MSVGVQQTVSFSFRAFPSSGTDVMQAASRMRIVASNPYLVTVSVTLFFFWTLFRCLKEEGSNNNASKSSIRFFIYEDFLGIDVKSSYGLDPGRCRGEKNMYSLEQIFPELAREDSRVTTNASEADFFIVPHDATCLTHQLLSRSVHGSVFDSAEIVSKVYLLPLLQKIVREKSFYNDSSGDNHVFVFSHDVSVCLFSDEVKTIAQRGIILSNLGLSRGSKVPWHMYDKKCFQPLRDVVVPPPIFLLGPPNYKLPADRPFLVSFRGTVWDNPHYSLGVRQRLQTLHQQGRASSLVFHNASTDSKAYHLELISSRFYLCVGGWQPWSPRLFEAIEMGAIPVIIADGIELPFERFLDWRLFSVKVLHQNVDTMVNKLALLSIKNIETKQKELEKIRNLFSWKKGAGAFETTLREIELRITCTKRLCDRFRSEILIEHW